MGTLQKHSKIATRGHGAMTEVLEQIVPGCDVMHDVFGHGVILKYSAPFYISVRFDDLAAGDRRMHLLFSPVTIHRDGIEIEFRGALPEETFGTPEPTSQSAAPDRAVEDAPANRFDSGFAAFAIRDGDEAHFRDLWKAAADLGDTDAMKNLGDLDRKAGDIAAATSWYVQAAEGGNPWAMKDLGDLADQRGDESAAREWWLRAVDADFSDNGLSPSSAEEALRQLAERTGDLNLLARLEDVEAMVLLGQEALRLGEVGTARTWFELAMEIDPNWGVSYRMLGKIFEEEGAFEAARSKYEEALERDDELAGGALAALDARTSEL